MATVAPFKGFFFNTEKIKDTSTVIIPPYDNIPAGEEKKYFERSPYNFAHVILPKRAGDDYQESKKLLSEWMETGVLKEETTPHYYVYEQCFTAYGETHRRRTIMATVELREFSEAIVRPHENTYGQYKADRLQILRTTNCNLSHIFGMVQDKSGFLEQLYEKTVQQPAFLKANSDEGVSHAVWKIDPSLNNSITTFFAKHPIYIVDGHHRYESSLMRAKELGVVGNSSHPASHMLFAISNSEDPALVVFPTHRVIKKGTVPTRTVNDFQSNYTLEKRDYKWLEHFVATPRKDPKFGLYLDGELYEVTPKNWEAKAKEIGPSLSRLSVTWSDHVFLKDYYNVVDENRKTCTHYERDLPTAWATRDEAALIIFESRPNVSDVTDVADEKRFMPQKSTYFYPKLAAGLIMRKL